MTFVFDGPAAFLFFGSFAGLFWILLSGLGPERESADCPLHPGQTECAHRQRKG